MSAAKVTTGTRAAVWMGLLDVARVTRYAEIMEIRYRTAHRVVRFGLLLSASASVAAVLDRLPDPWGLVSGVLIAGIIIWDLVTDYATKIAALKTTKRQCQALEDEWRELWRDVDSDRSTDAGIRERHKALLKQFHYFTAPMDEQITVSDKVNEQSAKYAYQVMEHEYASR